MIYHSARWVFRQVVGLVVLAFGLAISLPGIPGPGFVFVLLGLSLIDYPGKQRLFRWLRTFKTFDACANWIHRKFRFRLPGHDEVEGEGEVDERSEHHPGDRGQ